jgi:hypothetical protein
LTSISNRFFTRIKQSCSVLLSGLYQLASYKRGLFPWGYLNPKTGKPHPPEHHRFAEAVRELERVEMAMEEERIKAIRIY